MFNFFFISGNPWDHHQEKLRRNASSGELFLFENGFIRLIPDVYTLAALHLSVQSTTLPLSDQDVALHPFGGPFPSRKDGLFYKTRKSGVVWVMKNAHRHQLPNIATFYSLNGTAIHTISDIDLEQIAIGPVVPNILEM